MRLIRSFIALALVTVLVASPVLTCAQDALNQVNNLLLNSQNMLGSIPSARQTQGMGVRRGQESNSFRRLPDGSQSGDSRNQELAGSMSGVVYQIHVLGEVALPGTYRVGASTRLAEAIDMVGGSLSRGSTRWVEVRRNGRKTKIYDMYRFYYRGDLSQNPYLLDNDVVFIPLNRGLIQINGAVQRPTQYEISKEKNLFQIITLAGGYTKGVLKSQPIKVIRYANGSKEVLDVSFEEEVLKSFKIKAGDVYYVPQKLLKGVEFDYTLSDIPGDKLFMPAYDDQVYVLGGVVNAGPVPFTPSFTLRHYIASAGGFAHLAKRKRIDIIDQSGNQRKIKVGSKHKINPGDTIIIDQKRMDSLGWVQFTMGLATFSLSIASTVIALQ
jgi:protein involved in polysaccharide export with SLBB domain